MITASKVPVVLVTGAASGIGAAVANLLRSRGDTVIYLDRTESPIQDGPESGAGRGESMILDVSDDDACSRVVAEVVGRYGRVDGLVHCAGVWAPSLALRATEDAFDTMIGVNLVGSFVLATAVGRAMIVRREGGAIVLIASVNAVRADKGQSIYAASKGGVLMLAQVLALEWAEYDIRVNSIGPGIIDTPMVSTVLHGPGDGATRLLSRTPMARAGRAEEIAEAAAFLLSPAASFISGTFLPVDGGWLAD